MATSLRNLAVLTGSIVLVHLLGTVVWAGTRLEKAPRPAVADKVADVFIPAPFDQQKIGGLLGERMQANLVGRLLRLDLKPLLEGFQKRPGVQDWIGEHAGKFLHAAANTWAYTGNPALKERMDQVARDLMACQKEDGYLGTYLDDKRWTSWDVWVHKYDLIGLLAYYQVTGDKAALQTCRKIGDLLCRTFGTGPGQRNLMASGTHVGMAPASVLEPMCMLYRMTGDKKYLDFCWYIVKAYDGPQGPRIVSSLLEHGQVNRTANGKAYEMLSNLVGLADLYRLTGDKKLFKVVVNAWQDIEGNRLYITGTSSLGEHFQGNHDLQATGAVGEMCVTVTWMQLNWQLLRLTGEAKFADELERTVYNALFGAQRPEDGQICYFTPLIGKKGYGSVAHGVQGVNCCISSGQRGFSLIPAFTLGTRKDGLAILLFTPGEAELRVPVEGKTVNVKVTIKYPVDGMGSLTLHPDQEVFFPIYFRIPPWAGYFGGSPSEAVDETSPTERYFTFRRTWKAGDKIQFAFGGKVQVIPGGKTYPHSYAIQRGPLVLVLDEALSKVKDLDLADLIGKPIEISQARVNLENASKKLPAGWKGSQAFTVAGKSPDAILVPYADAGQTGGAYRVWLGPKTMITKENPGNKN